MGNWKLRVNASTSDLQHVAGLGEVEPGKWVTLKPEQVEKLEQLQRMPIAEMAGGAIELKDPDGKTVEPVVLNPPEEEEEATPTEKEEDS